MTSEAPDLTYCAYNARSCGIYRIRNIVNGKCYIGSTKTFGKRMSRHRTELRNGTHCNGHLQSAWVKYGEISFDFQVLLVCPIEELNHQEGLFISRMESANPMHGYNLTDIVNGCHVMSDTTKAKISLANMGKKISHKTRHLISLSWDNRTVSDSTREKTRIAATGKTHTVATRAKISAVHKGKTVSRETRMKLRLAHLSMKASLETKAKMSESHKQGTQ